MLLGSVYNCATFNNIHLKFNVQFSSHDWKCATAQLVGATVSFEGKRLADKFSNSSLLPGHVYCCYF